MPGLPALSLPHVGPYVEIGRAFERLFGCTSSQNLMPPAVRMVGVYRDDPTLVPEAELRSRATLLTEALHSAEPPLEPIMLRGGDYAVLRHKGPYADMRAAYLWLFGTWLPQSRREVASTPVLEEYLNNPRDTPPTELLTDLYLPLE